MEVYGVYVAASLSQPKPRVFAIKGVSDYADPEKGDSFQSLASYASAATAAEFLERYFDDLVDS